MIRIIQCCVISIRNIEVVSEQFAERKLATQVNPVLYLVFQTYPQWNVRPEKGFIPGAVCNSQS